MRIDFEQLRTQLSNGDEYLVDGGYLEPDIQVIYNYYENRKESCTTKIKEYFEKYDTFNFLTFLKAYLYDTLELEVSLSYTDDGWLQISLQN